MRNTTYFFYDLWKDWRGCAVMIGLYMLAHIYLGSFIRSMEWNDFWTTPVWGASGILIFSWLNKAGYKIELEKKRFERWRDIAASNLESSTRREEAAHKILQSEDLNQYALNDLFFHFQGNAKIINSVLDKFNQLQLKNPTSDEQEK